MGRYWNDFLSHSLASNNSGSGQRSNHKYSYREFYNGKWRYYYPEDLAAMRKTGTVSVNTVSKSRNDLYKNGANAYTADKRSKEAALKRQLQANKKKLRAQGVSSDAIQTITDDAYRQAKTNYVDTRDSSKIYRSYSKEAAESGNAVATTFQNDGLARTRAERSAKRNTKNALSRASKKAKKKLKNKGRNTQNLLASVANRRVS